MFGRLYAFAPALVVLCLLVGLPAPAKAESVPVDVSGTSWAVQSTEKVKIRGAGLAMNGDVTVFHFGPNAGEGLEPNEFKAVGPDATSAHGTYTADAKGKIQMSFDPDDVEAMLPEFIEDIADNEGVSSLRDLHTTFLSQKVTGRVRNGRLQVKFKITFWMEVLADFEYYESKGTWSFKGEGGPH